MTAPRYQTIGEILAYWARQAPQRPAVSCDGRAFSFAELDRRSNRLAHGLAAAGVEPGARAVVMSANLADYPTVHFGTARAGVVAVHVPVWQTPRELAHVIGKTSPAVVFADAARVPRVMESGIAAAAIVAIGEGPPDAIADLDTFIEGRPEHPPAHAVQPDDPLCIVYTGGTTGVPKGALASHRGRLISARAGAEDLGLDASDIVLVTTPMSHSAGLFTWYQSAALAGATAVLMAKWEAGDFIDQVARHRVTGAFMVPAQLAMLLDHPGFEARRLAGLRLIVCGGAPTARSLIERAGAVLPGAALVTAYGTTEAGHLLCHHGVGRDLNFAALGRPGRYIEMAVLDRRGRPAAPGAVGEIASRGGHHMLEYYGEPELTAQYFTGPDGWGRSGDLGSIDGDGFITLVGREQETINSGGHDIYPAELEAVLARHPAVRDCAVFAIPDPKWGQTPAAAVVLGPGARATANEITAFCAGAVAAHKKISLVLFVEALPRTAAGKLRRSALKDLACH